MHAECLQVLSCFLLFVFLDACQLQYFEECNKRGLTQHFTEGDWSHL